ncbi:MAG: hypothetical protein OQK82_01195 [Candidatus Pacearchaeota archaeon]|nr:hypothetical protein [Candidatus Pacearchaeota archaeon]
MSGFAKLQSSIIHSTIWREPHHIRIVWITMLAMADSKGVVEGSVPGLADAARVNLRECIEALDRLKSTDEWSRDPENQGRRIEDVPGGWVILNYLKYRDPLSTERVRKHREKQKKRNETVSPVSKRKKREETVETPPDPDPEADPDKDKKKIPPCTPPRGKRKTKMPQGWSPNSKHKELANELSVDIVRAEEHFRDHCKANGKTFIDWNAGFRTWLHNAPRFGGCLVQKKTALQQHEDNQQFLSKEWMKAKEEEAAEDAKKKQDY